MSRRSVLMYFILGLFAITLVSLAMPIIASAQALTATPTATGVLPDLRFTSATVSQSPSCQPGMYVHLTFTVTNSGGTAVGPFVVSLDGLSPTVSIPSLAPGASYSTGSPGLTGLYRKDNVYTFTADAQSQITESNETNNVVKRSMILPPTCTPPGPTLTPTSLPFPQADFAGTPLSGAAPLAVQFTPLYTSTGSPILSCSWTFGDGTSDYVSGSFSTCPPTSHVYTTSGNFTVELHVTITDMVFIVTKTSYVQVTSGPTSTYTPTAGITDTPTRTPTGPTPTFTRTPTLTPTVTGICSPVTSTITAPFAYDGAGNFCWQSSNLGSYVNSWNVANLAINGVNKTNLYVAAGSYPAKVNGYWYVSYSSNVAWGHFEAK